MASLNSTPPLAGPARRRRDEHGFAIPHLQFGSHGDASTCEQAVGHGSVQQRSDHPAVQEPLEAFEAGVTEEHGADAPVILRGEFQSQPQRVGLVADQAKWMGFGLGGFEQCLTGGGGRLHIQLSCGWSLQPPCRAIQMPAADGLARRMEREQRSALDRN